MISFDFSYFYKFTTKVNYINQKENENENDEKENEEKKYYDKLSIIMKSNNYNKMNLNEIIDIINNLFYYYEQTMEKIFKTSYIVINNDTSKLTFINILKNKNFNFNLKKYNIKSFEIIYLIRNDKVLNRKDFLENNYYNNISLNEFHNLLIDEMIKLKNQNKLSENISPKINIDDLSSNQSYINKSKYNVNYNFNVFDCFNNLYYNFNNTINNNENNEDNNDDLIEDISSNDEFLSNDDNSSIEENNLNFINDDF